MKAVPGILPTLLEMIYFFSTPTIDVEPKKRKNLETIAVSRLFVELLGRFELPTSSLPTGWEPSSP